MGKSKIKPFIIAGCIILVIGLILGIYFYVTTDFIPVDNDKPDQL